MRNLGVQTKSIDYVEIDDKAVRSYNAMFERDLQYKTQSVVGWNLRPDILIHGSPCQDVSILGYRRGADEDSGTRSSLMWETIHIIKQMGRWKPRVVIWENVKGINFTSMRKNFQRYLCEMEKMGYKNSYSCLDARDFGIPQARERIFTISCLDGREFDFGKLQRTPMKPLEEFLQKEVSENYFVTQPSILNAIGKSGINRTTIIKDFAYTITERQDRCPAQVIDCGNGKYRFLTELECWRLFGYSDEDYYAAEKANPKRKGANMNRALYKQAGNSIVVPIFESIFQMLLDDYFGYCNKSLDLAI